MDWQKKTYNLGIDIGSTTVKIVLVDDSEQVLYRVYKRHNARQAATLQRLLAEMGDSLNMAADTLLRVSVCGSGGRNVADAIGVPFVQEVVANVAAVSHLYDNVHTAIELGGQDAKVVFFHRDAQGRLSSNDMRMNGSCAGGTGAFIDEIAQLLRVPVEEFNDLAEQGTQVYAISGRCGVFAKTDIQPLLLQGARPADIALSTFHAIAKQTIGGLAQGLELSAPIVFEGGPLTFNPRLIKVFAERLGLQESDYFLPRHAETMIAFGAAMAGVRMFAERPPLSMRELTEQVSNYILTVGSDSVNDAPPLRLCGHANDYQLPATPHPTNGRLGVYIGIDSGSTTGKFVLMDEQKQVIDTFYANNFGKPIDVLKNGLLAIYDKYHSIGIELNVLGVGTTGYGEHITAEAFGADVHTVETVAHVRGCLHYIPKASFILDIGGQDMKAIWLQDGAITNIMLNEACSSGCGSFLENFASTLDIKANEIATHALRSTAPAYLGSRCTVFMTSTIITAQRQGKQPDDLMAGLCRSIIENVFTKVIRIHNKESLGEHIVVQGGTFRNDAVLAAMEEYVGHPVLRAPFPGEMGAIGAALLAAEKVQTQSSFIGWQALRDFSYETQTGLHCGQCENNCALTLTRFSTGKQWLIGNRCNRGAQQYAPEQVAHHINTSANDLFQTRMRLLLQPPSHKQLLPSKGKRIGIPLVLEFWDSLPFWHAFFVALGYDVLISHNGSRRCYEDGLQFVASDTICFPAKLVHGHIIDLVQQGADIIFFPYVMHMPPEGTDKLSPYMCSVLQGYPMVVRNAQAPEERYGLPFHTPIFHWFGPKDRKTQITAYATDSLAANKDAAQKAFLLGEEALFSFRRQLRDAGSTLLHELEKRDGWGVVLAGRPYQSDPMVNHRLSSYFTHNGVSVFTVDSLPGIEEVDLRNTRAEITNNFHTRMLSAAYLSAINPCLEYAQMVSFGCGHDAILTDEITRILHEVGEKSPLVVKIDESDANGALSIRVQSFVESIRIRRGKQKTYQTSGQPLQNAFPTKFLPEDKHRRTLLIPNISKEISVVLAGLLGRKFVVKQVPIGGVAQIHTGKQYSHNDICFPCQMVIGELIDAIRDGNYAQDDVAVGMVKFQCDCRMSHYSALLRKALDAAGFDRVPVVTTDPNDTKNGQPGVKLLGPIEVINAVYAFMMLDVLKELARKIRPYETKKGETDRVLTACTELIGEAAGESLSKMKKIFPYCIHEMEQIAYDRTHLKPRVFVTGELLVTYHPGSNFHIEEYLEQNGLETVFPRVTDQLRKDFLASMAEIKDYHANIPKYPFAVSWLFDHVQREVEKVAVKHPLYVCAQTPDMLYQGVKHIIPKTLSCGEGWLMAAEIAHLAKEGVRSFVILQPFGCLPNHVCGRGVIRALKKDYPDIQILPLDLDPDTSYANVENRLQMLIMSTT